MSRAVAVLAIGLAFSLAACSGSQAPPGPCDSGPGNLNGGCLIGSAGQCVEWGSLSGLDLASVQTICSQSGGNWLTGLCADAGLVGMCTIPPPDPNTGVTCSPNGTILQHYYTPSYTQTSARTACSGAIGTHFIPYP